jgi:hypothetical protein
MIYLTILTNESNDFYLMSINILKTSRGTKKILNGLLIDSIAFELLNQCLHIMQNLIKHFLILVSL